MFIEDSLSKPVVSLHFYYLDIILKSMVNLNMPLYKNFICIEPTQEMQNIARLHAKRRTEAIVRQFIPRNSPLSHIESNYFGALGEIIVRCLFEMNMVLNDNYDDGQTDSGDICIAGRIYDIKTEAVPNKYYRKLFYGEIQSHEPYGCRVWTARHEHHLHKYTGGIIFVSFPIPNGAKKDKQKNIIRDRIAEHARQALIVGYVDQNIFAKMKPDWFSPADPVTGKRRKYNSLNYIFHHSNIYPIAELKRVSGT